MLDKSIYIAGKVNSTAVEIAIQYNDGYSENVTAFANCVNTKEGGTHMTGFRAALTRVLNDYARKNKFLKENDPNLIRRRYPGRPDGGSQRKGGVTPI